MIIHNINLSNRFIDYKNAEIDLNAPGFYLILGPNGAGKTTLLENIVFEDMDAVFPDGEMTRCYHSARYRLFSYVQQNVEDCDMSVEDYILKDNPGADLEQAKKLLDELKFDGNNYSENVQTLSGGERLKAAFVSALIKETPYLFLDEPTNYLDDSSVECMIRMLRARAADTVIVIVSHDERIMHLNAVRYTLDGKTITRETGQPPADGKLRRTAQGKKPPFRKIAWRRINQPVNYIVWLLVMIAALGLTLFLQYFFYLHYNTETIPSPDLIAVYSVDRAFDTLNQSYCAGEGLEISDTVSHNMINMNDIPDIAEIDGCKEIFIQDTPKYMAFSSDLNRQSMIDKGVRGEKGAFEMPLYCFAMPEVISQEQRYLNLVGMTDFSYLTKGRLPKDGADEASVSVRLLQKYFGFSESDAENAIGKTLTYEGKQYEIVGIQYADVCILSYSDTLENCGIYRYDPATFPQFEAYYNAYIEENEIINKNAEALTVITKSGAEKSVLNRLMQSFPANNYYSSAFAEMWARETNSAFVRSIWPIVLLASLMLGICFFMIQRRQIILNVNRLNEYNRYYADNRRIGRSYCVLNLLLCGAVIVLNLAAALLLERSFGMLRYILLPDLLCMLLLVLPSTLYICIRVLRTRLNAQKQSAAA